MKIDIESIEDEFFLLSQNIKYGKRHYNEFSDHIMSMSIEKIKDNNILIKARTAVQFQDNITQINLDENGYLISSDCTCSFHNDFEPCGHVWMLANHVKDKKLDFPYTYSAPYSDSIVEFFRYITDIYNLKNNSLESAEWIDKIVNNEIYDLLEKEEKLKASLLPKLNIGKDKYSGYPYLSFNICGDRDYVIRDINEKIIYPYQKNEIVKFGKMLTMKMNSNNFDELSNKFIDLFFKYSQDISGDKLYLNSSNINDFYEVLKNTKGHIFSKDKIDLYIEALKKSDFYEIKAYIISDNILSEKVEVEYGKFLISSDKIFYFDSENDNVRVNEIGEYDAKVLKRLATKKLVFTYENLIEFIDYSIDKFKNIKIKNMTIKENLYSNEIERKIDIYCDFSDTESIVLNIKSNNYSIFQIKSIEAVLDLLNIKYNNVFDSYKKNNLVKKMINESFEISKESDINKFIDKGIPALSEISNVYLSESLKNFNKPYRVGINFGVKYRHNLLEVDIESEELSKDEVFEILNQYRKRKKYFKLKSGRRILIDRDELQDLDNIVSDLYIKDRDIKNSSIKLDNFRIFQLNKLKTKNIEINIEDNIENKLHNKDYIMNSSFNNILRSYQKEGVEWLLKLRSYGLNGILADDMGLGKTLQTIAYLASTERKNASLIVCPASLIFNWKNEFEKFNPEENIICIHGTKEDRDIEISKLKDQVVITSYDYLKRDIDLYEKIHFDTIIIDEAQYIKNHNTKASQSVKKINADFKIALTGTPIENSLAELWSIFDFLMRGYLFKYDYFSKKYEKPIILYNNKELSDRLKNMVEPFILRRLKTEVLNELPEKIEDNIYIEMNPKEKELYRANVFRIKSQMADKESNKNIKFEVLAMLTRLRQICIDPRLLYSNISRKSSKIQACMELIDQCIDSGKKIILFSTFTSVLDLIVAECNKNKINHLLLTGSTNKMDRKRYVDSFQNGDIPLFLISLKAGGTGLNLTEASVVIHIDPWWNISAQNQATDRAYRIGQKNKVQVYNLISKDTIEEKILNMQSTKKEISDLFVENSFGSFNSMNDKDLLELFNME